MDYGEHMIRRYVALEMRVDRGHYEGPIKRMTKLDLGTIPEEELIEVVGPFLHGWGSMQMGLWKFPNWESELAPVIYSNAALLEDFRPRDLATMDLAEFKSSIENLYESFKGVVGKVGATKVLHLICPYCLPPWDNYIGAAVWEELKGSEEVKLKPWPKSGSGADYFRFVQQMQVWLLSYREVLSDLAKQCRGSTLGVLHAYLWWATHRPLYQCGKCVLPPR